MGTTGRYRITRQSLPRLFICALLLVSIGCASTKKTTTQVTGEWTDQATSAFVSSTRINMGPFAEHLIGLIGDLQFGFGGAKVVYTRPYMVGPETQQWGEMMTQMKRNLAKVIAYSGRVVSLASSRLDGPGRAKALANFINILRPLDRGTTEVKFKWTQDEVDAIVKQVGEQQDLLSAIQVAEPLVIETARFLRDRVDEMKAYRSIVELEIKAAINSNYADMLSFTAMLKARQSLNYQRITALVGYADTGDAELLESLKGDHQLKALIGNKTALDAKTMNAVMAVLTQRLALINQHKEFISADISEYRLIQQELNALVDQNDQSLQKAKIAIIIWSQANQRLAAGETDPARFDFMTLAKFAFDLVL